MKNVVFDIGGVILEWRPYEIAARLFDDEAARKNIVENILRHSDWSILDSGVVTWDEMIPRFAERSGLTQDGVRELMRIAFDSLDPKLDTLELATDLKRNGVSLYCLSDMPAVTYDALKKKHTFFDMFDGIVISSHVKMTKKTPDIFGYLLKTFSLDPSETVFIDDLPGNIQSAESCGITGILFESAAACRERLAALGFPVA